MNRTININNLSVKLFSKKENYKDKFKSFAKEQEITPEQARKKKEEEEIKLKQTLEDAKKLYEEESKKKKELFEKIKKNEPIDNTNDKTNNTIEIDISMSKIKDKFSSVFSKIKLSNKETNDKSQQKQSTDKPQQDSTQKQEEINDNKVNMNTESLNVEDKTKTEQGKTQEQQNTGQEETKEEKAVKKESLGKRFLTGFIDVWNKTFPGEENIETRFEKRREEARLLKEKIKEATEEEIQKVYCK
jgi:hypothetical protein